MGKLSCCSPPTCSIILVTSKRVGNVGPDKLIGTCLLKVVRSDCQPVIQGSDSISDVRSPDPKTESTTGQRKSI